MALRKATVGALFPSLIWIWTTISITDKLSTRNSRGISTVAAIFLFESIAHDRTKITEKLVVSIQPVVQSQKTHLNIKSFPKIKIHESWISLARGKSLQTKIDTNILITFLWKWFQNMIIKLFLTFEVIFLSWHKWLP